MTIRLSCIFFFLGSIQLGYAQFQANIVSDRPSMSCTPWVVGKKIFQTQTGFDFGRTNFLKSKNIEEHFIPNSFFRYGISEHFEINSLVEYRYDSSKETELTNSMTGISLLTIGGRYNVYQGEDYKPAIGVQFFAKVPLIDANYELDAMMYRALVMLSQPLSKSLSCVSNIGLSYFDYAKEYRENYTLCFSYNVNPSFGLFVENYGEWANKTLQNQFDIGFFVLLNSDLQLDFHTGSSQRNQIIHSFFSLGASWRTTDFRRHSPRTEEKD